MKKVISLVLAVVMILAMGVSTFAAPFVGSVAPEYKIVSARILDANGNPVESHGDIEKCLYVTHVTESDKAPDIISEEIALLLKVYKQLINKTMKIPYEKFGYDPESAVLVDLYDITIPCDEHEATIAPKGIVVEVVLEANVPANAKILVTAYKNGEWTAAEKAVNNGDGTITCVFEHFCPVAISVVDGTVAGGLESNPSTGAPVAFGAVAVLAAAACTVFARKK